MHKILILFSGSNGVKRNKQYMENTLCATFSANVNIKYRLPIKVYYRRHIKIEINHGSQNVLWVLYANLYLGILDKLSKRRVTNKTHSIPIMTLNNDIIWLRNKSWKPECALSFSMDWRILVFYPEPKRSRDRISSRTLHFSEVKHALLLQ
jgi:hypothetical protein